MKLGKIRLHETHTRKDGAQVIVQRRCVARRGIKVYEQRTITYMPGPAGWIVTPAWVPYETSELGRIR